MNNKAQALMCTDMRIPVVFVISLYTYSYTSNIILSVLMIIFLNYFLYFGIAKLRSHHNIHLRKKK